VVPEFGPVMQLGFVVPDLEAAIVHWSSRVGVGPFFVMQHIKWGELLFRGQPSDVDMSVAVAQWGEVQVELIQQWNESPSIYTEFPLRRQGGLQHLGVMTDSVPEHLSRLKARGIEPVQWGATSNGVRFAYVDSDFHPGGMIELIESGRAINGFFKMVREAAQGWDGSDPVRRL